MTIEDGRIVGDRTGHGRRTFAWRALAPGFVNDHSHAFQRGLRGAVERIDPSRPHDDFWTWRERMYGLAEASLPTPYAEASRRCYEEMLSAGYTSVTEFHYVHHRPDGTPYRDPNALAKAVALAAEDAGIRLLLLPVAYARGGLPRFRDPPCRRSCIGSMNSGSGQRDARWSRSASRPTASGRSRGDGWRRSEITPIGNLPLHIHADEQEREIEECFSENGVRPVELLAQTGFLRPDTTIVHATHADESELDLLAEHGASVCACPTTEGNLGDGFLPAVGILDRGIRLSVGSDSHVGWIPSRSYGRSRPTPAGSRGAGTSLIAKARSRLRLTC